MPSSATDTTTADHATIAERYARDGYVIVPALYDAQAMLRWKEALQAALQAENFKEATGVRVWMDRTLPEPVMSAMSDAKVVDLLKQLIGPDVEFLSAKAVFKNATTKFGSPWHQDWFYWEGAPKLSIWLALDDATEANGCLKVVPGSHKRVFSKHRVEGGFEHRIREEDVADLPVETLACRRGDAVFFTDLLVHSSHPNTIGGDRWSLISTYRNAAVRDDSKVWQSALVVSGRSVNQ